MNTKSTKDRLLEAETSLAHLERRCDVLNQVVIEQGKIIQRLQTQMERLTDTMKREEMERIRSNITKPPHSEL